MKKTSSSRDALDLELDVHNLSAHIGLNGGDRIAVTDESTTGDPTQYATLLGLNVYQGNRPSGGIDGHNDGLSIDAAEIPVITSVQNTDRLIGMDDSDSDKTKAWSMLSLRGYMLNIAGLPISHSSTS